MTRSIIFINSELRPDLLRKYGVEPVDIEDAIHDAITRGASPLNKQDGVGRIFLDDTGKEQSEPGPDPQTGKEVSEPEPTGKEVSEPLIDLRVIRYGDFESVEKFIRPII